jgi:hypothetical protein
MKFGWAGIYCSDYDNDLQWFCLPMCMPKNDRKDFYKFLKTRIIDFEMNILFLINNKLL